MFDVIVNIEKLTLWSCRDTVCTAYPLRGIDTIDEITGQLNQSSVLSLVVYGVILLKFNIHHFFLSFRIKMTI